VPSLDRLDPYAFETLLQGNSCPANIVYLEAGLCVDTGVADGAASSTLTLATFKIMRGPKWPRRVHEISWLVSRTTHRFRNPPRSRHQGDAWSWQSSPATGQTAYP
jgi:hypothetical protein